MRTKIVVLAILFPFVLSAQQKFTLNGYVRDGESGEVLPGVNILTGNFEGAVTNDYGFYSIVLTGGKKKICLSYLGYKNLEKEILLNKNLKLDFELQRQYEQLDEVIINSAGENASVRSTEMSVVSLNSQTIKKLPPTLGEPDILKSIQLLPGVSSATEASAGFNVRGGSADQNLVLLDEATIYNASHLFGFYSVFNNNAIKNLKLIKGGIPSIYGGRLSSVLDIKQKEGNSKKFGGEASIGLIASKILIEGPFLKKENQEGKGSFMLAARRSYVDLFSFLSEELKDSKLYFYDINLKTNYALNENNHLFLSGYFGRDKFELKDLVGTFWGNASGTLRWTSILNEKLFLQTSAIYSNYYYNLDNLRSGSEHSWESNITNYNLKPRISWFINENNTFKAGLDLVRYKFQPGKIKPIKGSSINYQKFDNKYAWENSAYINLKQKISNKLSLQYGLRYSTFTRMGQQEINLYESGKPLSYDELNEIYEENEISGTKKYSSDKKIQSFYGLEPRFSLRYLINNKNSLKFSYNRMYQYIHLISNTTSATPLDIWAPSGPYIEPQYANQVAVGFFKSTESRNYDFNVEAYYKKLHELTDFIEGADLLLTENIETQIAKGKGRAYGLELQINKNSGRLTGWLSYTLAKSESKIKGINNGKYYPVNNDQLHELNLVGFYQHNKKWNFGFNFIFGSGRPVTYPIAKYEQNGLVVAEYNNRNGNRLPVYHRLDLSANFKPRKNSKGKWIFSIANIYNRKNASSIYFKEISEVNDVEMATGITEATKLTFFGIVPSITYEFKF
ncbi:MAG: TonB-dependent receptor [Labilibaculum sp.]|nr:TonB-dependent receptor [Labilibaculum sp.]